MPKPKEQQQHCLRFQGAWKKPDLAAYACEYLNNNQVIDKRSGLQLAISSIFGPVALALQGASVQEVDVAIAKARIIFETQMSNAKLMTQASHPGEVVSHYSNGNGFSGNGKLPLSAAAGPSLAVDDSADDDLIPMD